MTSSTQTYVAGLARYGAQWRDSAPLRMVPAARRRTLLGTLLQIPAAIAELALRVLAAL